MDREFWFLEQESEHQQPQVDKKKVIQDIAKIWLKELQNFQIQIEIEKAQNYDLWKKVLRLFYTSC